jgi:hypothetical protein
MARQRQTDKQNSTRKRQRSQAAPRVDHETKLKFVVKHYPQIDPDNTRAVSRRYRELIRFPLYLQRPVENKSTRDELKRRGFFVTEKGVIVDGPRNVHRQPIKGSRVRVSKNGTVVFSNKRRRDFIVGFTPAEKKEFAKDPDKFTKKKLDELRKSNPSLRRVKRPQVRLQWGAYQATKDFTANYFSKQYFAARRRTQEKKIDKLTGLHIVIHIPRERKTSAKKSGRKNRRS